MASWYESDLDMVDDEGLWARGGLAGEKEVAGTVTGLPGRNVRPSGRYCNAKPPALIRELANLAIAGSSHQGGAGTSSKEGELLGFLQ